uniref:DUF4190 domain-containing protein n=1 Tax=Streptomyces sp. NBC_00049 TaxID=2903617 RepID=A0AAU2JX51_9ACTN
MTENSPEPRDLWAPPERPAVDLGKAQGTAGSAGVPGPPSVHDQPTLAGMPGADTPPPNPTATTAPMSGPATPAYGYPAQPDTSGYGYPTAPPARQDYGYPTAPFAPQNHGYPAYPGYPGPDPYQAYGMPKSNGFGITALVLGILSVVGCITSFIAVAIGIAAVIFGALGKGKANRGEADNGGMALAGIILGAIGIVLGALMLLIVFAGFRDLGPLPESGYDSPYSDSTVHEKV